MQIKGHAVLVVVFGVAIGYFAWVGVVPGIYVMLVLSLEFCSEISGSLAPDETLAHAGKGAGLAQGRANGRG